MILKNISLIHFKDTKKFRVVVTTRIINICGGIQTFFYTFIQFRRFHTIYYTYI